MTSLSQDPTQLKSLLARIAQQDRAALRALYDATAGALLAVAHRVLNDRAAAEDVLQEVFVGVWGKATQLPELRSHPMAWLTATVRNRAIDALRRRRPDISLHWHDADGEERSFDAPDENTPSPPEQLQATQCDQQLTDCLQQLEPEPRHAVQLAYFEGLTHAELAERLVKPLGTIKAWVRRSLDRLRLCMGEVA
jgi:RNA polymerase sigma-70 factor, ECF subfamily